MLFSNLVPDRSIQTEAPFPIPTELLHVSEEIPEWQGLHLLLNRVATGCKCCPYAFFYFAFQLSCLTLDTYPQIKHLLIISFPKKKVLVVPNSGEAHWEWYICSWKGDEIINSVHCFCLLYCQGKRKKLSSFGFIFPPCSWFYRWLWATPCNFFLLNKAGDNLERLRCQEKSCPYFL